MALVCRFIWRYCVKVVNCWEILNDRESLDFKRVVNIKCVNCGYEDEIILDSLDDLKDIKCSCIDKKDRHSEYLDSNMGLNLKLSKTYKKLEKSGLLSEDFDKYFKFKKYCLDNGYKPWYVIDRKDKNKKYSLDNILITCGKVKGNSDVSFDNIREASNSICLLENMTSRVLDSVNSLVDTVSKFDDNEYMDNDIIKEMKELSFEALKICRELKDDIDKLDVKFK